MSAVGHIFRKDARLLWPLIAMVALLQSGSAGVRLALGHFAEPPQLVFVAELLSGAMFLGMAILIVAAVQQDKIPGIDQDWLIRPIRRGELILAKLLFLIIAVQGPMVTADVARSLLAGTAVGTAIATALLRAAVLFLTFDLPVAGIATVTGTAIEAIGVMLALWVLVVGEIIAGSALRGGTPPFAGSGMQWMVPAYWSSLALIAAVIVIPMQYFRRATGKARAVVLAAVLMAPLLSFSSWSFAFGLQQRLSPHPAAAEPVAISFDPTAGPAPADPATLSRSEVALPVRVSGLPMHSVLKDDHAIVRLTTRDGKIVFVGPTADPNSVADDFPVRTKDSGEVRLHQLISIPAKIIERFGRRPVRMEIDYSLTLLARNSYNFVPALYGDRRMRGLGWCRTRSDSDEDDVVLGCLTTSRPPDCVSGTLVDPATGKSNPEDFQCRPDYAPYSLPYVDVLQQFSGELKFRDPNGLARYPVTGGQLTRAQAVFTSYSPLVHFTRRLIIPQISLSDWTKATSTH